MSEIKENIEKKTGKFLSRFSAFYNPAGDFGKINFHLLPYINKFRKFGLTGEDFLDVVKKILFIVQHSEKITIDEIIEKITKKDEKIARINKDVILELFGDLINLGFLRIENLKDHIVSISVKGIEFIEFIKEGGLPDCVKPNFAVEFNKLIPLLNVIIAINNILADFLYAIEEGDINVFYDKDSEYCEIEYKSEISNVIIRAYQDNHWNDLMLKIIPSNMTHEQFVLFASYKEVVLKYRKKGSSSGFIGEIELTFNDHFENEKTIKLEMDLKKVFSAFS